MEVKLSMGDSSVTSAEQRTLNSKYVIATLHIAKIEKSELKSF